MGKQSSKEDMSMKSPSLRTISFACYFLALISFEAIGEGMNLPDVGKFRVCDFSSECALDFNCDNIKRCDPISPFKQDCKTTYGTIEQVLGINTKIPEVRCNNVRNDELKKCESERALAISKCKERQSEQEQSCLRKAEKQEDQCSLVKMAEIEAAKDLELSLNNALEYLSNIEGEEQKVTVNDPDSGNSVSVKINVVRSKDYSSFWSFMYNEKKYADWKKVPSLGYSSYRTFVGIGNFLVMSPDGPKHPTDEMLTYTASSSILFGNLGVDGVAQLYIHQVGYIEEYLVKKLNK